MTSVGVVTVGRSDYGLLRPILRAIAAAPDLDLRLYVSGGHLAGASLDWIAEDGFPIAARVVMLLAGDRATAASKSVGVGILGWAEVFAADPPDLIVLLGDRFEMHAVAVAALPFRIPIAHIHGGELTQGAFDDALRHSLTKLSHLHFVAHQEYADRVLQMGEEPWRVVVSGAPALDAMRETPPLSPDDFMRRFGFSLPPQFLLATLHPETLAPERAELQTANWISAIEASGLEVVFTAPNCDPGHGAIAQGIAACTARYPRARFVPDLGPSGYYTAMRQATAMVGNSSSGLLEAASWKLPVVNLGQRQEGRIRPANVIDCGDSSAEIQRALQHAVDPSFRAQLAGLANPFGDGNASSRIVAALRRLPSRSCLLHKRFISIDMAADDPRDLHSGPSGIDSR